MKAMPERHVCGFEGADPTITETPRDLVEAKGKRTLAKRQRRVDVLAQLHGQWQRDASGKSGITDEQYRAGRLFQQDCERAELRARGSGFNVGGGGGRGIFVLTEATLMALADAGEAKGRLKQTFGHLGQEASRFAMLVLQQRASPSAAAVALGWNAHAGLPVLRLCLNVLAQVYVDNLDTDVV